MKKYRMTNVNFYTKKNWEGIQMRNGFDNNFGHRMYKSRRLFYQKCKEKQLAVAGMFNRKELMAKPQLAPFFLFSGNELSADTAIGWTIFLEYQKQAAAVGHQPFVEIEQFLKKHYLGFHFGSKIMEKLSKAIAETLQIKLALVVLSRKNQFEEVEIYRVMTCNLMDPTLYSSIEQTLRWCILYDDILPDSLNKKLNPGICELFELLRKVNAPYLFELKQLSDVDFLYLGKRWGQDLLKAISKSYVSNDLGLTEMKSYSKKDNSPTVPVTVAESKDHSSSLLPYIKAEEIEEALGKDEMEKMKKLTTDLYEAAETPKLWETPKPDQIAFKIINPFEEVSSFQGELQDGDYFEIEDENGKLLSAEVLEESLPVSNDQTAIAQIQYHAEPITEELDKIIYNNSEKTVLYKISNSARSFQNNLLPLYKVKDLIYKKTILNHRDSKGKPVVVLMVDMSGSMKGAPLECTKIITAAWSEHKDIKLLAGAYTTAASPHGTRAIVRWIYHPKNTMGATRNESLGRIVSISDMSLGGNEDAAALFKILSEVRKMASSMDKVYLIHLTDTGFCKSFKNSSKSASSEIDTVLKHFKQRIFRNRLHVTLVALANSVTQYDMVDELCQIPSNIHQDYLGIAKTINETLGKTISKTFK